LEATHGKYTVRVHCQNEDEIVDVKVVAEVDEGRHDEELWGIAEKEHNSKCMTTGNIVYPCGSQALEYSEGWE
jgi:hypothetical protein